MMRADSDEKPEDEAALKDHTVFILKIMAKAKVGQSGSCPCPKCGKTIRWALPGPRAFRLSCDTPNCLAAMS